ncbi:MAG: hypothetical protein AB7H80_07830 [Candidatus Kapaibacterium sp.]
MNQRRCQHIRLSPPFRAEYSNSERFPWGAALRLSPRPHSIAPFGSGSILVAFYHEDCGCSRIKNFDVSSPLKKVHHSTCPAGATVTWPGMTIPGK